MHTRKTYHLVLAILAVLFLLSCSNTKFLAEDETLYTGIKEVEIIEQGVVENKKSLESSIYWSAYYKPNNSFYLPKRFLPPVRLWIFNYMATDKEKGFKHWIHKNFSQEPVLTGDVDLDKRSKKIESDLFNNGYFGVKVSYDLNYKKRNPKKASVTYRVLTPESYKYNRVNFPDKVTGIDTIVVSSIHNSHIKSGNNYNLNTILKERQRITYNVREDGYYKFQKEYVSFDLDSTIGDHAIDINIEVFDNLPDFITRRYTLNTVSINMIAATGDSIKNALFDTITKGQYRFIYNDLFFKPQILEQALYQKPGEQYKQSRHEDTREHLGNFEVFKQINIRYDTLSSQPGMLDMSITLTPLEKISLSTEANMVTKSSGYAGPAVAARLLNQNTFGGGEKFNVSLTAGFEWQTKNRENTGLGFNSYELGLITSLSYPKIISPIKALRASNIYVPQTSMSMGFELLNRVQYYKMNSFNLAYAYTLRTGRYNQHSFSPANFNLVALVDTTAEFSEIYKDNPSVRRSFEEQTIFSIRYRYSYDNSLNKEKIHRFAWESGTYLAGALLSLIDEDIKIFGTPYSSFFKVTQDFRYYYTMKRRSSVVNRIYVGLGIPYGQSTILPYVEQFFSGGANSVRGFVARSLGPGSYRGDTLSYYDQTGDIKLEYNLEYRYRMGQRLFGAVFLDVGNIWLANEDELRPGSGFNWNSFYRQFAVGTGFGIRFDLDFFVIRFDVGIPLRNPGYEEGERWIFENKDIFELNGFLAIGYPF